MDAGSRERGHGPFRLRGVTHRVVADGKEPGSVRSLHPRLVPAHEFRRLLERSGGLPLRPTSVRLILQAVGDEPGGPAPDWSDSPQLHPAAEIDPGWALAQARPGTPLDPLALVAERTWWPAARGPGAGALQRLWLHAVAVSQVARRLAREAGEADSARIARAGLLHGLGRWAVAALDPEWFATWLAEANPYRRRERERHLLGTELTTLGRALAERWGCDPLVADAAWLHADGDGSLNACGSDPDRLRLIQQAYAWAERTPWALAGPDGREPGPAEPRLRMLIAEVQVRCGAPFVEPDATPHEERLARSNARLRRHLAELLAGRAARDRFLDALAGSDPTDDPETWAERAGLAWCGESGAANARVLWTGPGLGPNGARPCAARPADDSPRDRPPSHILPLSDRGRPCAEVHLWADPDGSVPSIDGHVVRAAWAAWAALVAERARLHARLESVVRAHRDRLANEEPRLRQSKLDALAEFAAGAGHELNNPLAVIVGRAQLLLVRETDPGAIRSLRAILHQAQRAHRILRDLMYVARPPELRPRFCQPEEIVRSCLRDFKAEADARGVRLLADQDEPASKVWADPDALRHLTEVLLRNALEATPRGGTIHVIATGDARKLRWTVRDNGRGVTPEEGSHLFDPFYCGRQAGRGLGLGLPRAARIVAQAGGELLWHSTPGQGTIFHLHLPLAEPPKPPLAESELSHAPSGAEPPPPQV